jgi:hypothetical protein
MGEQDQVEQRRRAGTRVDASHTCHLPGRKDRDVRKAASDGPRRPSRRDRALYIFFASNRTSGYYSGEVLAPTGGETLPG